MLFASEWNLDFNKVANVDTVPHQKLAISAQKHAAHTYLWTPNFMCVKTQRFLLLMASVLLFSGCAEGMFWKSGYLSPWVRQRWSDEEEIAATLFSKRTKMREVVEASLESNATQREQASEYLASVVANDPVLLLRIEATRLLAELDTDTAKRSLQLAAKDREVEVRIAAVRSLARLGGESAGQILAQMARNDANIDVRISATALLGQFDSPLVKQTLREAINDPDPAMQLRAAESLAEITGQNFGNDILAWQDYLQRTMPDQSADPTQLAKDGESEQQPLFH